MKRKAAVVAEAKTRPAVRAVKARPAPVDPLHPLATAFRVQVLRRGELRNADGEGDNGWVVRDDLEGVECVRFVLEAEPWLTTLGRTFAPDDFFLDVMAGDANVGALQLEAVRAEGDFLTGRRPPAEGVGRLFDAEGREISAVLVRPGWRAQGFDPAHRPLLEVLPAPGGLRVMARRLTIATATWLTGDGLIPRALGLEVALERTATLKERLLLLAALVLSDAWQMERRRHERERRGLRVEVAGMSVSVDLKGDE